MSWWQQYQGFVVVGALLVLLLALGWVRGWSRRMVARAGENAARGAYFGADLALVQKQQASLATAVRFAAAPADVVRLLESAKLPWGWSRRGTDDVGRPLWGLEPPTGTVVLEADGEGAVLLVDRADDSAGLTPIEPDWRKLRRRALEAAAGAGVPAEEVTGPALVRVPLLDPAGRMTDEVARGPHQWRRPA